MKKYGINHGGIWNMMSKKLKALVSVFLCALCVLVSTVVCSAVSETYTLNEIDDMSVTLPDGMTAVTRSSNSSDKYFSLFGLDYNATMDNFKSGDIYLQGMNEPSTLTITVTMTKTEDSESIKNYNLLDRDKLTEIMGNFLTQTEYSACTPDQSSDKQIVWMLFDTNVTAGNDRIKAYQAHTVYDGMSINVTLQRNGSNVTNDDYSVFSGIVSSVSFGKASFGEGMITAIIIAAALIVIILLLIFIIRLKRNRRINGKINSTAESRNERILKELADEYNLSDKSRANNQEEQTEEYYEDYSDAFVDIGGQTEREYESSYIQDEEYERQIENNIRDNYFDENNVNDYQEFTDNKSERYVSDEEVDEILSGAHSLDDSVAREVYRERKADKNACEKIDSIQNETEPEVVYVSDESEKNSQPMYSDNDNEENLDLTEDGLTELDEFNNDEVLVREDSKQSRFEDSYDFFEEAPKKKMGIISNKEIDEAEDYDVINEIEQRATKVSREESKEPSFAEKTITGLKKFGRGVKSFGVHCGYFCTNVYRMIKRKRAIAKRKKAEQERIERAKARAERQRQQRRATSDGSLVKVHSRTDRRPAPNSTQNRNRRPTPSQVGRKPSSSQSSRNRKS